METFLGKVLTVTSECKWYRMRDHLKLGSTLTWVVANSQILYVLQYHAGNIFLGILSQKCCCISFNMYFHFYVVWLPRGWEKTSALSLSLTVLCQQLSFYFSYENTCVQIIFPYSLHTVCFLDLDLIFLFDKSNLSEMDVASCSASKPCTNKLPLSGNGLFQWNPPWNKKTSGKYIEAAWTHL